MMDKGSSPETVQKMRQALAVHRQGRLDDAERLYREILATAPNFADAWHFLGVIAAQKGDHNTALERIGRGLAIDPKNAAAHYNLGNSFHRLGRHEAAIASFDSALEYDPNHLGALNNRGTVLVDMGRHQDALNTYGRLLARNPDHPQALSNRGNILTVLRRPQEALVSCDRALALRPDQPEALVNRGNALRALHRPLEALASYDRALAIAPGSPDALNNRGSALMDLRRFDEALAVFDGILKANPRHNGAWCNRGAVFIELQRFDQALACFDNISADPPPAEMLYGKGYAQLETGRNDEAVETYETLFRLYPDHPYGAGMLLHAKRRGCDWAGLNVVTGAVIAGIRAGKPVTTPYAFIPVSDSEEDNRLCAEGLIEQRHPPSLIPLYQDRSLCQDRPYGHGRIRLAYLSSDFREHPVATLIAGVLERHDRARFETIGVSLGADDSGPMRRRLTAAFEHFLNVRDKTPDQIAAQLAAMEIDIAVDLTGFTGEGRTGIFAGRPAPIQVNYLGYPATMGAAYYDYILADPCIIPPEHRRHYTEKVVYLPGAYMPADRYAIADLVPPRAALGLPDSGFVFASFNNPYKITPEMFDLWMRLLQRVEGSVLWLTVGKASVERNLRREAQRRFVSPERLVFTPYLPARDAYLARMQQADLFLDTFPCNAHSTACDALWAGLPLLTCPGNTFAGRVAASLLNAVEMPELIAEDLRAYESVAFALAGDPQALRALREKLRRNRPASPLFDSERMARHLESAFTTMVERHANGLPPAPFVVAPVT